MGDEFQGVYSLSLAPPEMKAFVCHRNQPWLNAQFTECAARWAIGGCNQAKGDGEPINIMVLSQASLH